MSTKNDTTELPITQCKCNVKILVIPDVKAMDRAIDAHLAHCPLIKQSKNKSSIKRELCDYMIEQVFKVAAEQPLGKKAEYRPLLEGDTSLTV